METQIIMVRHSCNAVTIFNRYFDVFSISWQPHEGDKSSQEEVETAAKPCLLHSTLMQSMPLKWNLHFFLQSLYCHGIHRVLKDYDFIGYMDRLHGFILL